jgi:hypothetical protein
MSTSKLAYSTSTGEKPITKVVTLVKVTDPTLKPPKKIVKPRAKKHAPPTRRNGKVFVIKMDERVWKVALKLAKGDTSRIQRIKSDEVIVHNPGRSWA